MPVAPLRAVRALAVALMGALVIIGIAMTFVVHGRNHAGRNGNTVHPHTPSALVYLAIAVLGLIAAVLVRTLGYRIPPLSPNVNPAEARSAGFRVYQQSMILRFALCEWLPIICIAATFAVPFNTVLPYVEGAGIAFVLMAFHVWPSQSLIRRVQAKLDRNGGHSDLAAALAG